MNEENAILLSLKASSGFQWEEKTFTFPDGTKKVCSTLYFMIPEVSLNKLVAM